MATATPYPSIEPIDASQLAAVPLVPSRRARSVRTRLLAAPASGSSITMGRRDRISFVGTRAPGSTPRSSVLKTGLITGLIKTKSLTASLRHGALLEPEIEHGTFRAAQAAVREGSRAAECTAWSITPASLICSRTAGRARSRRLSRCLRARRGAGWPTRPPAAVPGEPASAYVREQPAPIPAPWAIAWLLSWSATRRHAPPLAHGPRRGADNGNPRGPRCPRLPSPKARASLRPVRRELAQLPSRPRRGAHRPVAGVAPRPAGDRPVGPLVPGRRLGQRPLVALAAMRLGASRVHSLDFDEGCVACTRELRHRYFPDDPPLDHRARRRARP